MYFSKVHVMFDLKIYETNSFNILNLDYEDM